MSGPYCQSFVRRMRLAWEHARQALQEKQLRNKADFDSAHTMAPPLQKGQRVLLHEPQLVASTSKLTRGLAWTGPYRIEEVSAFNNVKLRDLRNNRLHPEVHMNRLRLYKDDEALGEDEYLVDELLGVRRVKAGQARGASLVEFLVKWRGYGLKETTWEPLEALTDKCEDLVEEFCDRHARHPVVRWYRNSGVYRNPRNAPTARAEKARKSQSGPAAPTPPRSEELSPRPVAAKFQRGQWFYEKQSRRSDGRVSSRWYPSVAFSEDDLKSAEFKELRSEHLLSLDAKEAALVAVVSNMGP